MSKIQTNNTSLEEILETINNLPEKSDGIDTSDATATADDILSGKTAYVKDEKITGTIVTKTSSNLTASGATVTVPAGYYASNASKSVGTATQATPSITINSNGLITATVTQSAGYVSAGSKSGTKQLTTQAAKTITPSTSNQTAVASRRYTTGAITVKGDSNLKAENIKNGVSIFGVSGTLKEGIDTSDATASADEIFNGETAYVNGSKVTGNFTIDSEITEQTDLISQIKTALEGKASGGGSGSGSTSLETCTVTITNNNARSVYFQACTSYLNNEICTTCGTIDNCYLSAGSSLTIENVLNGSAIVISYTAMIKRYEYSEGVTFLQNPGGTWTISVAPGYSTATIVLYDDD